MWSRSHFRASRSQCGYTQCRSRRITSSRIQAGGSWVVDGIRPGHVEDRNNGHSRVPHPLPNLGGRGRAKSFDRARRASGAQPEKIRQRQVEVHLGLGFGLQSDGRREFVSRRSGLGDQGSPGGLRSPRAPWPCAGQGHWCRPRRPAQRLRRTPGRRTSSGQACRRPHATLKCPPNRDRGDDRP